MLDRQVHNDDKDEDDIAGDEDEMQMGSDDEMLDRTGRRDGDMDHDSDEGENDLLRRSEEKKAREGKDNTQVRIMNKMTTRFSFHNFIIT